MLGVHVYNLCIEFDYFTLKEIISKKKFTHCYFHNYAVHILPDFL